MALLEIKNLHVNKEEKQILRGIDLTVEPGKVHVIMGPNGSGKSTLASVIMGHPGYEPQEGSVLFQGEEILQLPPNERAKKGIFLSFQYPKEIAGVTISNFLRSALQSLTGEKVSPLRFQKMVEEKLKLLRVDPSMLQRYVNEGFSGGEKKRAEILQMLVLNPKLAILDEIDSGLDIDALKFVAEGVNAFKTNEKSVLIITHYKRILDYIKPDNVSIIVDGKVVLEGGPELVDTLEEKGYGWITKR